MIHHAGVDAGRADFAKAVREADRLREAYYHDPVESKATYGDEATLVAQTFRCAHRKWLPTRDIAAAAGLFEVPSAYSVFRRAAVRAGVLIRGKGPGKPLEHY